MWLDKEEEPCCATYGTMLAELEVQRTIQRAELCAISMALSAFVCPSTIHTDIWASWMGCGDEKKTKRRRITGSILGVLNGVIS